ncbi:MAG TPA: single-stranded-DNA-specific exonuclease RecJ [Pirellulales bacterium]|jgi:single-stranded-DNA-specific exonuclease
MPQTWRIYPHDPARIQALERAAGISAVAAQLLVCRGITDPDAVRSFLNPLLSNLHDPERLPGAGAAADCLLRAVTDGLKIVVYGDYDVDGMSGTALLVGCLKLLSADVSYYVPNRIEEGYGLNDAALRRLAERGFRVVVTVDCGIASVSEAALATELGLQLIITDHHTCGPVLPAAQAIVHPAVGTGDYPFAGLCGAGVAFKLAWVLCQRANRSKRVSQPMRDFLLQALALVALGTVADVVPLIDENRALVRHGLESLKRQPLPGLAALMAVAGLTDKPRLSSEDIAFSIAPRLNAAGRLGQATLGVELLTTTSPERGKALAEYLHELNGSRESLERSVYLAARKQVDQDCDLAGDAALVLAGRGWHPGVIGIVAGRLAEKFHRPVVLIALDEMGIKPGVGSARGVAGFDLHAALSTCTDELLSHGGHAMAAGLKIDPDRVTAFRASFCKHAATALAAVERPDELRVDAEVPFSGLSLEALTQLDHLAPFGHGNPRPMLCTSGVTLVEPPRKIGAGGRHLSLRLAQHGMTLRAVAFGAADWDAPLGEAAGSIAVAFRPVINDFRGRRTVELQLCDWRPDVHPASASQPAARPLTVG